MKKSLTINATRGGKKVAKNIGYVNPDVANSLVGGFAQMFNALTADTFVNAEIVKKMDTSEEEQAAVVAKTQPTLTLGGWSASDTVYTAAVTYDGDGTLSASTGTISNGTLTVEDADGTFSGTITASEGTNYAAASLTFNHDKETVQGEGTFSVNTENYSSGEVTQSDVTNGVRLTFGEGNYIDVTYTIS